MEVFFELDQHLPSSTSSSSSKKQEPIPSPLDPPSSSEQDRLKEVKTTKKKKRKLPHLEVANIIFTSSMAVIVIYATLAGFQVIGSKGATPLGVCFNIVVICLVVIFFRIALNRHNKNTTSSQDPTDLKIKKNK